MPSPQPNHGGYTYADYLTWDDGQRWELINGEAILMSPAPELRHQGVSMALGSQIWNFLRDKPCQVFAAPLDVRLPGRGEGDKSAEDVVQPDLVVICDPTKLDRKGCRGAPEWIIEILSPSTAARDHLQKRELYERYGVRELWLVHPVDQLVWVYRLGDDGTYGAPALSPMAGTLGVAILLDLTIDWDVVVEALPPRAD